MACCCRCTNRKRLPLSKTCAQLWAIVGRGFFRPGKAWPSEKASGSNTVRGIRPRTTRARAAFVLERRERERHSVSAGYRSRRNKALPSFSAFAASVVLQRFVVPALRAHGSAVGGRPGALCETPRRTEGPVSPVDWRARSRKRHALGGFVKSGASAGGASNAALSAFTLGSSCSTCVPSVKALL